jgi:nucleotide-binding universal stress UspA family protein
MSYRNILLHLDGLPACRHRVEAALDLAVRFDARVVGLATTGTMVLPAGFNMVPSGELIGQWQEYLEKQAHGAVAAFEEAARLKGVSKLESRIWDGSEIPAITLGARYADLVVIGQVDPASRGADGSHLLPGDVVLGCPRPVLVIPYIGAPAGFGKHVLVAWNGSREACRAVTDALPLMQKAQRVTVMAVNPEIGDNQHGQWPGADLAAFLAHHDVKVEVQADNGAVDDIGEELLSRVADIGADLVVMGAYGHSRAQEWVFGGATRTILTSMTVPVLMAH